MTNTEDRLDGNAKRFDELIERAERALLHGRHGLAAVQAQVAAEFAWLNHTGWFSSRRLEQVLLNLGEHLPPAVRPPTAAQGRTLHVVTQVYQTGGPTQAIVCWTDQSHDLRHLICLTRQGPCDLPVKLRGRLGDRVVLTRLDDRPGSLLRRAAALRALAAESDAVLLHTHPYDVVPVLALAQPLPLPRPSVTYVNHADHVFWLGTSVADRVMNMRDSGRDLAVARRGVPDSRNVTIPRPLNPITRTVSQSEARRQFRIPDDRVLIVTAAESSKYGRAGEPGFLEVFEPVLERFPQSLLLAAGPSPAERSWMAAADRSGGRIRALGRLPDVSILQQAADIYVDSFPFASLTSLLEAGAYGTPVVTYQGHPAECAVLGSDTRGVDEHMVRASTPDELHAGLGTLIADAELRRRRGEGVAEAILSTHTGPGWRASIKPLYEPGSDRRESRPVVRSDGPLDALVEQIMSGSTYSRGVDGAMLGQLGLLPTRRRLQSWAVLAGAGLRPPRRALFPEWCLPAAASVVRWVRRPWKQLLETAMAHLTTSARRRSTRLSSRPPRKAQGPLAWSGPQLARWTGQGTSEQPEPDPLVVPENASQTARHSA